MKGYKQLNADEREKISVWKAQGLKIREIARRLERSPGTISDEIQRNSGAEGYRAYLAQFLAQVKRHRSTHHNRPALKNSVIYSYVLEHLRDGWSPELIAGRLKIEYPAESKMRITPETIYRFVYSEEGQKSRLWEYLPWKRKKRRKRYGRKVHRSHIPQRISISKRSQKINEREEFGHWEGDTIESKGRRKGIHTEVERKSRYLEARKVESITSEACIRAQLEIFSGHPEEARRSTTMDNGRENHSHRVLKLLKMKTYFAHPYSAWERGTNEFHNGLIRRYLPKGTNFDSVSEKELKDIVLEINSRPRKVLGYLTPIEVYNQCVKCSAC